MHLYGGPSSGDDTFIYMRYAGRALAGDGFVYNAGESSYGVTSPLWLGTMTSVAGVFGNTIDVWKLGGSIVFGAAACLLFLALRGAGLGPGRAVLLASFGVLEPNNVRWASSGMENGLVLLSVVALATTFRAAVERPRVRAEIGLGVLLGLLPFARPELAILAAATALAYAAPAPESPRMRLRPLAAAVIVAAALAGLTWLVLGGVVPQTVWSKAFLQRQADAWYGVATVSRIMLTGAGGSLVLLACSPGSSWSRRWRIALLASLLVWIAAFVERNQLVSTRYASYLVAPLVVTTAWLLADSTNGSRRAHRMWLTAGAQAIVALAFLTFVFPVTRVAEGEEIRRLAEAAREETDDGSRIALTEIGAFGFYSDRYIVDLVGLTDNAVLDWRLNDRRSLGSIETLEEIFILRRATHYVETSAGAEPLAGRRFRFRPVAERSVSRNNFSGGRVMKTLWRMYALDRVN